MTDRNQLYLSVADAIGTRLSRDALWSGQRCNWLGAAMEPVDGSWKIAQRTFGPELYSGTSGIALFLGRLYAAVDERIYRMAALGAIRQALARVEDLAPMAYVSFYSGITGIAHTCTILAQLLDEPQLTERGLDLLATLPTVDLDTQGLDVLSGCAGAIPALLRLGHQHQQPQLIDRAVAYGQHLLKTARQWPFGCSWDTMGLPGQSEPASRDLLGFSHGTAGIAWSLLELYQETQHEQFRQAAEAAFQYERYWFSPQQQNWPDLRNLQEPGNPPGEPGFMLAWCHGAPGIGLSRVRAFQLLGDRQMQEEAIIAANSTARVLEQSVMAAGQSFCLCHGLAGNAELLLYAHQVLGNSHYLALAEQIGQYGALQYHASQTPWPCGVLGAGETPGLFLGLAGIGYFYLRLSSPQHVPPITIPLPDTK